MVAKVLALLVAGALVTACVSFTSLTQTQFASDHGCAPDVIRERFDMEANLASAAPLYEVTGCGHDVIYACDRPWTEANGLAHPAQCSAMPYCVKDNCGSDVRGAVRDAFVKDASCPADRIVVDRAAPERPQAEIASDPARVAIWKQTRAQQIKGLELMTARGCETDTTYGCTTSLYLTPSCARRPTALAGEKRNAD
jgi:hypothetical protein